MVNPLSDSGSNDLICHRCGCLLTPGEGSFYIVRIEAVADPSPPLDDPEASQADFVAEWEQLISVMREMSEQELIDQVYRRVILHLCAACYQQWIEDPTKNSRD